MANGARTQASAWVLLAVVAAIDSGVFVCAAEMARIAIIKADDVRDPSAKWKRFIGLSRERNVKVSCGVICNSLVDAKEGYTDWLKAEEQSGFVEFWNHGWDHKRWDAGGKNVSEFGGSGKDHQKDHFLKSQQIMKTVLGAAPLAFGTPFNAFDADTAAVLREDGGIKLVFCYRDPKIEGVIGAAMSLRGEADGTGKPNAEKFAADYQTKKGSLTFAAIQFHPNSFPDDRCFDEYARILDLLIKDGWTFMLPKEYVAYCAQKAR